MFDPGEEKEPSFLWTQSITQDMDSFCDRYPIYANEIAHNLTK